MVVVNNGGRAVLLRNDGGNRGNWLQVALRGTRSNRQGIGARLRLVAGGGAQVRQVGVQPSYLSQSSTVEHFGLDSLTGIDTLEVIWPSGLRELRTLIPINTRVLLVEGDPGAVVVEGPARLPDRQQVLAFWEAIRSATSHRVAGRIEEAAADYQRAVVLDPRHEDALYYLGNMRFELGDFARAGESWGQLVIANPTSARAHLQLGTLHLCLDPGAPFDPKAAASEFRRAHEINREETGSLLWLGEASLFLGDTDEARRQFTAVIGSHTDSPAGHFFLGYLDWVAGQRGSARESFRRAVEGTHETPLPAGASAEGDTRQGHTPLLAERQRCNALLGPLAGLRQISGGALEREMTDRYRTVDSVLREGRRRSP